MARATFGSNARWFGRIRLRRERDAWVLCVSPQQSQMSGIGMEGRSSVAHVFLPHFPLPTRARIRFVRPGAFEGDPTYSIPLSSTRHHGKSRRGYITMSRHDKNVPCPEIGHTTLSRCGRPDTAQTRFMSKVLDTGQLLML
jgi:hypothetical protein